MSINISSINVRMWVCGVLVGCCFFLIQQRWKKEASISDLAIISEVFCVRVLWQPFTYFLHCVLYLFLSLTGEHIPSVLVSPSPFSSVNQFFWPVNFIPFLVIFSLSLHYIKSDVFFCRRGNWLANRKGKNCEVKASNDLFPFCWLKWETQFKTKHPISMSLGVSMELHIGKLSTFVLHLQFD